MRPLSAGDVAAVLESWTVEFFIGGRIVARRKVFEPAAVVRLIQTNGAYEVEVTDPSGRRMDSERLIESMLPATVPSAVALLQARRNALAREQLLQEFGALTSAEVAELAGSRAGNKAALANRWKQEGRIFPVTHQGQLLFPAYQLDREGQPRAVIADILSTLGQRSRDWELALWFTSATGWLGARRPVDLLESDPAAVAEAARHEAFDLVF
ncbi:MAG TPA: hypothetical protein VE078_10720 [Thermoanaerobaculia bacterium]|nr:hypothetical protein [Thermoanaerobaculia bacterium]